MLRAQREQEAEETGSEAPGSLAFDDPKVNRARCEPLEVGSRGVTR